MTPVQMETTEFLQMLGEKDVLIYQERKENAMLRSHITMLQDEVKRLREALPTLSQ